MPDITQRIADILRRLDEESTGGDLSSRSSTGPEQWAEVLTTELGLTRQTARFQPYGHNGLGSRYVTEWVPDA